MVWLGVVTGMPLWIVASKFAARCVLMPSCRLMEGAITSG